MKAPKRILSLFLGLGLISLALTLVLTGCLDGGGGGGAALQNIQAKPAKSFITGANVYAVLSNGTEILLDEFNGTQGYGLSVSPEVFKNIEFFYSEGGIIELTGVAMDDELLLESFFNEDSNATYITPLTSMWKNAVGNATNASEVQKRKESINKLLGLNSTKDIAGDPDQDPDLEGAGWFVYSSIKGAKDTLKQSGVNATDTDIKDFYKKAVEEYEQNGTTLEDSVGKNAKDQAKKAGKSELESEIIGSLAKNNAAEAKTVSKDISKAVQDKNASAIKESTQLLQTKTSTLSKSFTDLKETLDTIGKSSGQNATAKDIDDFVKKIGESITKETVKQANEQAKNLGLEDNEDVLNAIIEKSVKQKIQNAATQNSFQNATETVTEVNATEIDAIVKTLKKSVFSIQGANVTFNQKDKQLQKGVASFSAKLPLNDPGIGCTLGYEGDAVTQTSMPFGWMLQKSGRLIAADTDATFTYQGGNATFDLDQQTTDPTQYITGGVGELKIPLESLEAGTYSFRAVFKPAKGTLAANASQQVDYVTFQNLPKGIVVWDQNLNKLTGYGMRLSLDIQAASTTTIPATTSTTPVTTSTAPAATTTQVAQTTTIGVSTTSVAATTTAGPGTTTTAPVSTTTAAGVSSTEPATTTTAAQVYWTPPTGYSEDTSVDIQPGGSGVTVYSSYTPGTPPAVGKDVYADLDGDGAADIKMTFVAAATGQTIYIEYQNTVKAYTVADGTSAGSPYDWSADEAAGQTQPVTTTSVVGTTTAPAVTTVPGSTTTSAPVTTTTAAAGYWTPPTGYSEDTSVDIQPGGSGVTVYSSYTPGTPPSVGKDVYADLDGNGAADVKLTFVAAATGQTVYIEYQNTVKAYTVADGTSAGSPYDWAGDTAAGQTQPTSTTSAPAATTTVPTGSWTPPTGYTEDTSVDIQPAGVGVTVYSNYTPGSPPSVGKDVYADLDGDGAADVKMTFVAAATGQTVYIVYQKNVKAYTVADGTSAGSPYDWAGDTLSGQIQ